MELFSRSWYTVSSWIHSLSPPQRREDLDGPPSLGKHDFRAFWEAPLDNHVAYEEVPHYPSVIDVLTQHFGKQRLLPRQLAAINIALAGYDLILSLPTSAGKSLCYQLPAVYGEGLTLVFSPTRLLIEDQMRKLHQLPGDWMTWAQRSHHGRRIELDKAFDILSCARILYICPEFLLRKDQYDILDQLFKERKISRIVLDEAHQALNVNFRPSYRDVFKIREKYPMVPFTLASASLKREDIEELTSLLKMTGTCIRVHAPLSQRSNLHFSVFHVPCREGGWRLRFIVDYIKKHEGDSGIIFAGTHSKTETLCKQLEDAGIEDVDYYHSDRIDTQDILERFQTGRTRVIVTTCAFGEGVDKQDIRFVVHYSIPPSMTAYFQETGRAGRDGKESNCILLYSFKDIPRIATIVANTVSPTERVFDLVQKNELQKVLNYCYDSISCRRHHIYTPFDDSSQDHTGKTTWLRSESFRISAARQNCAGCDTCKKKNPGFQSLTSEIGTVYAACNTAYLVKAPDLRERVALRLGIEKANTVIGFMVAVGALWMKFEQVQDGRFELWLQPGEIIEQIRIPLPIPYEGYLPRIRRQKDLQNHVSQNKDGEDLREDDANGDIDPIAEDITLWSPYDDPLESDTSQSPSASSHRLKQRNTDIPSASESRFVILFRRKLEDMVYEKYDKEVITKLNDAIIRRIYRNRDRISGKEDLLEVLEECSASSEAIELMKHFWNKYKDEILYSVEKELKVGSRQRFHPYLD